MRIAQAGEVTVALADGAEDVLAVLADGDEVATFVAPLLDDASTTTRWVVEPTRVGPVTVRPVADVAVARDDDTVAVRGRPVPGATPTWLTVDMAVRSLAEDRCEVHTRWEVRVDLPGPQFVAALARPLLRSEARKATDDLRTRLIARFA